MRERTRSLKVEADLVELVQRTDPEVVLATGDLAHRNKPEQQERAARLLRSLERPLVVVPGNHDIPPWPPARMLRPFAEFERHWAETEPVYRSERLVVCGLNSVRPWRHQGGALRAASSSTPPASSPRRRRARSASSRSTTT